MSGLPDRSDRHAAHSRFESNHDMPDREALEQVLRETLVTSDPTTAPGTAQIVELIDFARHHQGEPFDVEPLARQLVALLLKAQFPKLTASDEFWDQVSHDIATTLMDDPRQGVLLQRFWSNLCDKAA